MLIDADDLRVELKSTTNNGSMKPSVCSKAIAVFMKNFSGTPAGAARRHRWNMHVKLNLAGIITNTTTDRALDMQQLFDGGSIGVENPIEPGKFVIAIKNNVRFRVLLKSEPFTDVWSVSEIASCAYDCCL